MGVSVTDTCTKCNLAKNNTEWKVLSVCSITYTVGNAQVITSLQQRMLLDCIENGQQQCSCLKKHWSFNIGVILNYWQRHCYCWWSAQSEIFSCHVSLSAVGIWKEELFSDLRIYQLIIHRRFQVHINHHCTVINTALLFKNYFSLILVPEPKIYLIAISNPKHWTVPFEEATFKTVGEKNLNIKIISYH